ncbi:MAG TPA: type IV pilus assembly protein PilM [Verrucomicrobiae bacterium]
MTVDFGAGSLKLAEFGINEAGGLCLTNFVIKPLGTDGAQETTREKAILSALQAALTEKGLKAKNVNVCAPGFHVFSKFVKLPPVDASKVGQMILYEAQQNVPFPLTEVVWDYQILGSAASGELEVLLVAIKSDVVEGLFRVAEQSKLKLNLCDASPAALCNAFRFNYGELEDCTMLLDIGAKTSNLLFFEKGKVFSRSINLGANAITQDFANEAKLKFDEAEKIKIAEGFVSLGGAYEEPDNPHQAAISKIARQFMTRLHIQVNQTMQFYRGQQGGGAPQRLFLSGGASIMPYTAQFFAEKLNVPVEYFNPFRNVQIAPEVNLEELSKVAHGLGEVVGLGLRNLANCPVEMNLMPDSTLRWQAFNQKKPYLMATVFSLALVTFVIGFLFQKLADNKSAERNKLEPQIQTIDGKSQRFQKEYKAMQKSRADANQYAIWLQQRFYWADFIADLRRSLIRSEDTIKKKLAAQRPGIEAGVWIEQMTTPDQQTPGGAPAMNGIPMPGMVPMPGGPVPFNPRAGMVPEMPVPQQPAAADPNAAPGGTVTNALTLVCRAVDLSKLSGDASANSAVAYAVEAEIKASPMVDSKATSLVGNIVPDDSNGTFVFTLTVAPTNAPSFTATSPNPPAN